MDSESHDKNRVVPLLKQALSESKVLAEFVRMMLQIEGAKLGLPQLQGRKQ
jgi:hypothetical protein